MALELWPQFTGGSYGRDTSYIDSERTMNFYPETSGRGENNRSQMRLMSTPGINMVVDLHVVNPALTGPVYDILTITPITGGGNPRTFCLVGNNVSSGTGGIYLVEYRGTSLAPVVNTSQTLRAPTDPAVQPRLLSCGQDQILMTCGLAASSSYITGAVYSLHDGSLFPLTATATPGWLGASDVDFMDGYVIASQPASQSFYISAIQDATRYDPLDVAVENDAPDTIVGLRVIHRDLFIFGKSRILVWNNTGAAAFPFSRNNAATIEIGCVGPATICKLNDTLFWIGRDGRGGVQAWKMQGYNALRISTPAVEAVWQGIYGLLGAEVKITGVQCFAYQEEGHNFYVVNFPSIDYGTASFTWVFDDNEGLWHERQRGNIEGCLTQRSHSFNPMYGHLVGSRYDAKLYTQVRAIGTENGVNLVRRRTTPHIYQGSVRNFHKRLVLDVDPRVTNFTLQYYNKGNDSNPITAGAPAITDRGSGTRIAYNRLGSCLDRIYDLYSYSDTDYAISAAYLDVQGGTN